MFVDKARYTIQQAGCWRVRSHIRRSRVLIKQYIMLLRFAAIVLRQQLRHSGVTYAGQGIYRHPI